MAGRIYTILLQIQRITGVYHYDFSYFEKEKENHRCPEKLLNFIVSNYLIEPVGKSDPGNTGIGLKNIRRRLELLFPGGHDLTITVRNDRYTVNLNIYLKS